MDGGGVLVGGFGCGPHRQDPEQAARYGGGDDSTVAGHSGYTRGMLAGSAADGSGAGIFISFPTGTMTGGGTSSTDDGGGTDEDVERGSDVDTAA